MSLYAVLVIVHEIFTVYWWVLIAAGLLSWVPNLYDTALGQIITRLSEPYLAMFRRFIRPIQIGNSMLDVSFIVAVIVYYFVIQGIMVILFRLLSLG